MGDLKDRPVHFYDGVKLSDMPDKVRERAVDLLQQVCEGETPTFPLSRRMPRIGVRCHELRIKYRRVQWRIVYRTDTDVILVVEIFKKTTKAAQDRIIEICKDRLAEYDALKRRRKT